MPVPPEIEDLVNQLNQELDETEKLAAKGLNLVREIMSQFPNNASLIQFFAYFNTALFFVVNARNIISQTVNILVQNITENTIQRSGEDLAALLGEVLEAKMRAENIIIRLENLQ